MRVLFVSPFLPYPPTAGGHAMAWSWLQWLAERHEVAFTGFYEREADATGAAEVRRRCAEVRVRLRKPTPHAYSSFSQLPAWVTEFFSRELADDIQRVCRDFRPEVALFLSTNMAQYRRCARHIPSVVTAMDIVWVAYRRRIAAAAGFERFRARLDWLRMLRYELRELRAADHIVSMSDHDSRVIRSLIPQARVTAVPPGTDPGRYDPSARRPAPGSVLYLGHMEHLPNLDGLIFLYRDIWPYVRRACAEAHLIVAGARAREELARVAPEVLAAMDGDPSVELAGFVPDLRALMEATAVMAAPLRLGAGVRTKVIEALAAGLPTVTTARGAEGLSIQHGREVLVADDAEEFASQLVRLLSDRALQERLSAAGRETIVREHDNETLARRLEAVLASVAGTGG